MYSVSLSEIEIRVAMLFDISWMCAASLQQDEHVMFEHAVLCLSHGACLPLASI